MPTSTHNVRNIQLNVLQKFRQIYVFDHSMANHNSGHQIDFIKSDTCFVLRKNNNKQNHLSIWRSGEDINFNQLGEGAPVPARTFSNTYYFNENAGSILLGYKMAVDGSVETAYIIVGTGDFRDINNNQLPDDYKFDYWELPTTEEASIIVECTNNFELKIYSNINFR
jgi:hypothetical protein